MCINQMYFENGNLKTVFMCYLLFSIWFYWNIILISWYADFDGFDGDFSRYKEKVLWKPK